MAAAEAGARQGGARVRVSKGKEQGREERASRRLHLSVQRRGGATRRSRGEGHGDGMARAALWRQ